MSGGMAAVAWSCGGALHRAETLALAGCSPSMAFCLDPANVSRAWQWRARAGVWSGGIMALGPSQPERCAATARRVPRHHASRRSRARALGCGTERFLPPQHTQTHPRRARTADGSFSSSRVPNCCQRLVARLSLDVVYSQTCRGLPWCSFTASDI